MSATYSKLSPQSLASTLVGVGARECEVSLAYILFSICILKRMGFMQNSYSYCALFICMIKQTLSMNKNKAD